MTVTREQIVDAIAVAEVRAKNLSATALAVEPIVHDGIFMASVDSEGVWGVAIKSQSAVGHIPAVRLATLSAEYGVRCQLDIGGVTNGVRVSLVRCRTDDAEVKNLFVTFAAALVNELPQVPTEQLVADAVERWVSLFWRLQSVPRTDVIGLIGELIVLDSGGNTPAWAAAWHNSPVDAIDFGFTDPRLEIEVKATTGRERVHTVAVHQSNALNAERYFASMMVELRDTGKTVGDLAQGIADRLDDEQGRRRFWTTIADACGHQLGDYLATRFIRETSTSTLAFYPAEGIPAPVVELPLPIGVSDLRFRSDFSSAKPANSAPILGRTK